MKIDDPEVRDLLRRSLVARIATLSRNGRSSINPIYFIHQADKIWLGTAEWTLAARNVMADPRVCVLFNIERDPDLRQVLRIYGRANVRTDAKAIRAYSLHVLRKVILTPGGIRNELAHLRQFGLRRDYRAQSKLKGRTCIIEVIPEQVELLYIC